MEQKQSNKIIVFGGSHHNTLGVIRALGEKGLRPYLIVVSEKDSFVTKSRYIKKFWIVDDENKGIKILLDNFNEENLKPVLICTSDTASSSVDLVCDELLKKFFVPNAKFLKGRITNFMDKSIQAALAIKHGFSIPKSIVMNSMDVFDNSILFPVIIKPLKSINGSKSDIQVCSNRNEFDSAMKIIENEDVQVQYFIEKELEYQVIGCSLNGGSIVIVPGISRIIRCPSNTNTGYLTVLPFGQFNYDFEGVCSFLQELGYSGLFSIEFIRDKDGNDYFMEINFRNDGNAYSITAAGVNLPYIWYLNHVSPELIKNEIKEVSKQIYVMPEISDFVLMCKGAVSFKEWRKDLRRTNYFLLYNKLDKKPFFFELFQYTAGIIFRKIKLAK